MAVRWTVLASGSSGNASLLDVDGAGLLIDVGLGPRQFDKRLRSIGYDWSRIRSVLLSHTHSDHWHDRTLARLTECRIPLFCHGGHLRRLQLDCPEFQKLQFAGLVKNYLPGREFAPVCGVRCRPVELKHDGGPTFGFRIEEDSEGPAEGWAIGYAADLGSWEPGLPHALADVDLLALEFNHDVEMQLASRRVRWLIHRVLGEFGHLSNAHAARLLEECVKRSPRRRLRHLIQLHLSRECNRPALAVAAAREVLSRLQLDAELHTASQDAPAPTIVLAEAG
jgi:phosphoribosyl 1,2-cyclic phosphodiesterase